MYAFVMARNPVKMYFGVEIMARHTQQTKENKTLLAIHFICKCKPDPTKSQEKQLQVEKIYIYMAVLLIHKSERHIQFSFDKFHFPTQMLVSKLIIQPCLYPLYTSMITTFSIPGKPPSKFIFGREHVS